MREKLSDRFAVGVIPTPGKVERYFDQDKRSPRGFLLRVTPAGARVWAVRYRLAQTGREREITIGDVKSWPISEARRHGHELRREIDAGADPLAEREEGRAAPAVDDLIRRFEEEALASRAPRTQAEYRAMLRRWVSPAIGTKKVTAVTREDIEKLHRKITAKGNLRRANSVKSLCSTLFRQAIVWRQRPDNPASHIPGNPEHGRERYLSAEEVARLVAVLDRWRKDERRPDSVDAIELALLSGARRGEILGMRWADLDLAEGVWTKPAGTTKQRKAHRVPLSGDAVALLRRRQSERQDEPPNVVRLRDDAGPVFRGAGSKTHSNILERDWCIIRAAAGLDDVRFHDLRHSFASQLVGAGISLPVIGGLLGHAKPQTTARYAHLADSPLRDAAERVARAVRGPGK